MTRRILDTSVLIRHWQRHAKSLRTANEAAELAGDLIKIHDTKAIVTPIYIEFVAGARTRLELEYSRAYLSRLQLIDGGRILKEDWEEARRLAERVPRNGKPRQLGDCLIRAIARRLKYYDVFTADESFPV